MRMGHDTQAQAMRSTGYRGHFFGTEMRLKPASLLGQYAACCGYFNDIRSCYHSGTPGA